MCNFKKDEVMKFNGTLSQFSIGRPNRQSHPQLTSVVTQTEPQCLHFLGQSLQMN